MFLLLSKWVCGITGIKDIHTRMHTHTEAWGVLPVFASEEQGNGGPLGEALLRPSLQPASMGATPSGSHMGLVSG